MGIVTSLHSPWAHLEKVTPKELQAMPLLISSRTTQKIFDLSRWSGGQVTLETLCVAGRFDLIGNASLLVRTGQVNALGLDHLLQIETQGLKFIPLDPPLSVGSLVAWKKFRLLSRSSQVFLDRLKQKLSDFSH